MKIERRKTRTVQLGNVAVGGAAPVSVQSMCNTDTRDMEATVSQIERLADAGCDIVRVAVPDEAAGRALSEIRKASDLPLIADIHFNHRLALMAIEAGVDGLRINPGNIGERDRVEAVVEAAKDRKIPIRIGVNAGSLEPELWEKYGGPTPEAMVESAMSHVRILEELDFRRIKISLKAHDVARTVAAYRLIAGKTDYPLHIGITEAGTFLSGTVKSSVGLGLLLADGIGDTLRVSLTDDPVQEVRVGIEILKSLGLREAGPVMISCPTCGRCEIDLIGLAREVEERLTKMKQPLEVAVMGCVVNGPGEAREADFGIAGGKGVGLVFRKGKVVRKVREEELADALMEEIGKKIKPEKY
ncbi:MAG: flavodoxin-dependent (E)-4-hydroxy-3-methylbut-2-enyl-diphosphate synthase [Deltaproteobacteria bacterium]|nr:flavodoxin-dependent (E)-4-hydroxy-3-methylbut-2-enyl-diphosphate synthase [Deltaproteobacteria bacterium]